jgi:5-methylcytosine-specific restriction endonuclease McrA
MAKLRNLRPRIGTLAPRFGSSSPTTERERSAQRNACNEHRTWAKSYRWKQLREKVLLRDRYTCQMCGCIHIGKGTAVVDHLRPHRGDAGLFWDETNLQVLCKSPCHDSVKQAEEASMHAGVW